MLRKTLTIVMKQVISRKKCFDESFLTFIAFAGVNYRQLPRKGFVIGNSAAVGAKVAKERLTVMVCVSMTGEKRKLQVIGQSQKPRGFPKNVSDLPVDYDFSKNAWQTSLTMTKWLKNWDR